MGYIHHTLLSSGPDQSKEVTYLTAFLHNKEKAAVVNEEICQHESLNFFFFCFFNCCKKHEISIVESENRKLQRFYWRHSLGFAICYNL